MNTAQEHGRILDEREDNHEKVTLIYWGVNSDPKLTINVFDKEINDGFYIVVKDENVLDAYYHPYGYDVPHRPLTELKGIYA